MADNADADGDAEEKARTEAEARRLRILEKGKERMKVVSGLMAEADAEDEATKVSGAARMQAMRRRRFKKGAKGKEESKEGSTAAEETTKTNGDNDADAAEPAATTTEEAQEPAEGLNMEEPAASPTPIPGDNLVEETAESKSETETEEASMDTEAAKADSSGSKKYKGVAKMRREKMLQKKKEEAIKAAEEEAKNPASQHAAVQARRLKRQKQPIVPILMYLLTTFVLFLAGLDVGLQHADGSILVNRDFAPSLFSFQKLNPWAGENRRAPIKDLGSDGAQYSRGLLEEMDEFDAQVDGLDAAYVPNIDPLFRIDLDEATKGPGILNTLARGAVKIHRLFLYLFVEFPLRMLALPAQLIAYPPVMCLAAVTIRQVIGNVVLGAKLPDAIEEDVRNAKETTDVLAMIKGFVTKFVVGSFPTAVSLYEVFKFLKTDMYVMLFGVFVGLLWSSWSLSTEAESSPFDLMMEEPDEVIPAPDPPLEELVMDMNGIADEL